MWDVLKDIPFSPYLILCSVKFFNYMTPNLRRKQSTVNRDTKPGPCWIWISNWNDDDDLSPLQPKANPYQALKNKHERTNKENYRKVKVINQSATIKTCLHFIRTTTRSQRLLAHRNPPANHHTNVWIQDYLAAKITQISNVKLSTQ